MYKVYLLWALLLGTCSATSNPWRGKTPLELELILYQLKQQPPYLI